MKHIILFHRIDSRWGKLDTARVVALNCDATSPGGAIIQLKAAVTEWVTTTEVGKKAWDYSGRDLNIGDLAGYLDHTGLKPILARYNIKLEILDGTALPYDTVLAEPEEEPA